HHLGRVDDEAVEVEPAVLGVHHALRQPGGAGGGVEHEQVVGAHGAAGQQRPGLGRGGVGNVDPVDPGPAAPAGPVGGPGRDLHVDQAGVHHLAVAGGAAAVGGDDVGR